MTVHIFNEHFLSSRIGLSSQKKRERERANQIKSNDDQNGTD